MNSGLASEERTARSPLRVLFFEDCGEDVELSLLALRSSGFNVKWDAAVTPDEFIDRARTVTYDVILADYRMPGATGMDVFELLKSKGIDTPFILVTGTLGDEMAVECLKQGMADYVLKDRLARLPFAIRRALEEGRLRVERVRAEKALRSSEASYRSLIQSAPCGILRLSAADGQLLDANTALAGTLGYDSPADLLEGGAAGGIGLEPEALSNLTVGGAGAGQVVECEVQWKRKDGAALFIRLAGRVLRDASGAPTCLEMIAKNITERRLAQQRIEQLNRLNSVLIHASQTIVHIRESSGLFQEICRIIVEEGGFQMAWLGLLEPGTGAITPRASCPQKEDFLQGACSTANRGECCGPVSRAMRENRHVVCNDLATDPWTALCREQALPRSFRSLASFPIVNQGRPIGAITIYAGDVNFFDVENVALLAELAADVSFALESIEIEQMRDRAAGELDGFFALSLDMLCISDLEGYIQRLNPAWEKTLGFSTAEMGSKPWAAFVHAEDRPRALEALAALRAGTEVRHLELRFLSKSGSYKWLVGSAAPALERGVVFAAMTDITNRKQLEEQLLSQNLELEERNRRIEAGSRMKSEFLANMSHELRSPLNGIIGFSELLYDGKLGALPERPREFVGRMNASASHLLQLINGVLDLSKIEAGHLEFRPERMSLSRVIGEVTGILSALAAEKHIRIETEIDAGVDEVTIDGGRLRQVLYNYLSNALKFTGERGRIVVRVKSEGAAEFRLEVSDTGIGVSDGDLGRLFVEFQQLDATTAKRYQGTGLGLALTKRIVEAQGGRVGVATRLGEGSTFFAVLPRAPLRASAGGQAARILVIDDQKLDRFLLTHILQSSGYLVETVASCAEAYEKCRREQFDAITFDLMLQDGPGWEALARIRSLEMHRNTPVVVISGFERKEVDVPFAVEGFLTKPVRPEHLLAVLERAGLPMRITKVAHE